MSTIELVVYVISCIVALGALIMALSAYVSWWRCRRRVDKFTEREREAQFQRYNRDLPDDPRSDVPLTGKMNIGASPFYIDFDTASFLFSYKERANLMDGWRNVKHEIYKTKKGNYVRVSRDCSRADSNVFKRMTEGEVKELYFLKKPDGLVYDHYNAEQEEI